LEDLAAWLHFARLPEEGKLKKPNILPHHVLCNNDM
jgi:hypothetical protein